MLLLTSSNGHFFQNVPDSVSFGLETSCSDARLVGVRTTGGLDDLAFDAVLMLPESCGAGTDGSSGSIVSTSGLVLMLLAKVEWVGLVSNVTVIQVTSKQHA